MEFSQKSKLLKRSGDEGCQDNNLCSVECCFVVESFGAEFLNAVIAITDKLPRFTTTGNVGLKFFRSVEALFDFDKNMMYTSIERRHSKMLCLSRKR